MILKGLVKPLGYVSKEELDASLNSLMEEKTKFEGYKQGKEREVSLLKDEVSRMELENRENSQRLAELSVDLQKISKQYDQTLEDFRISEENSCKTQKFFKDRYEKVQYECKEFKKKNESIMAINNSLQKQIKHISMQKKKADAKFKSGDKKLRSTMKNLKELAKRLKLTKTKTKSARKASGKTKTKKRPVKHRGARH
ncbi:MAG: hypothetical protein ABIG39_00845 [Candidatus Micrarchaeota archaeon]